MCLIPKTKHVLIASRDFYVYKNFCTLRLPSGKVLLQSPYRPSTYWQIGETKKTAFFADEDYGDVRFKTRFPFEIDTIGRGLHSWTTKKQARSRYGYVTARCTIPRGTPYIIGSNKDIASLALRVDSIVRGKRHLR